MNLAAPGAPLKLGARLQTDPDFKQMIQQHLRGHLTGLVRDAHTYVGELVDALRDDAGDPDLKVVLLVDSVEQLRGNGDDATKVQQSVVELFNGQAASLALPRLHVVYTIPPYLQALSKNLGRLLGGHPIVSWPNVHVRSRTGRNDGGEVKIMQEIVERRFPAWSEIIPERLLTRMAKSSGGDLHPPALEGWRNRRPPAPPEPLPLGNDGLSALREWQRLRDRGATDRGALIAAERAFTMLRLAVRLDSAQAVARWMVEQSRARGESLEALRDLSVSLNNLGNIDRDLRRFDDARNASDESLQISERLAAALPDQPEFVEARDWLRQQIAEFPPSVSTDATG